MRFNTKLLFTAAISLGQFLYFQLSYFFLIIPRTEIQSNQFFKSFTEDDKKTQKFWLCNENINLILQILILTSWLKIPSERKVIKSKAFIR